MMDEMPEDIQNMLNNLPRSLNKDHNKEFVDYLNNILRTVDL